MKKLWIVTLLLLSLIMVLVACDKKADTPVDSSDEMTSDVPAEIVTEIVTVVIPVTEPETPVTTEPETNDISAVDTEAETAADNRDPISDPDLDIDDIMASVMGTEQFDLQGHYHLQTDLTMDMLISILGVETKVTLTGDISMKQQAGEAAALIMNLPTQEPYSMVYLDGMLYVTGDGGKYRCPLGDVEQALIWSELLDGLFPSEEIPETESDLSDALLSEVMSSLLSTMDASLVFEKTVAVTDEHTGDITVTLEGLSQAAQYFINELISSMSDMGGEEISDEDMSLALELLSAFDMDTLSLSMTIDEDMLLHSVTMSFAMDMADMSDLMGEITQIPGMSADVPVTMVTTVTTTIDRGDQEITAPADADTYEETDWRELFGFYTADMLGLVPDENGVITISEDLDIFARQWDYIEEHPEEFMTFSLSVTGYADDFSFHDDGSVVGYLYQVYENGSPSEESYLPVTIPAELADGMTLPQDESTVKLMLVLIPEVYDGYEYYILTATAYEPVSGPVAVG